MAPTLNAVPATTSAASRVRLTPRLCACASPRLKRIQRPARQRQQQAADRIAKGSTSTTWVQLLSASEPSSQVMIS